MRTPKGTDTVFTTHIHKFENCATEIYATCEKDGIETGKCVCGETSTRKIAAKGHVWDGFITIDKESTYTNDGESSEHCKNWIERRNVQTIPKLELE